MNGGSPAGTSAVVFSDVTEAETKGGRGLGRGGDWQEAIGKKRDLGLIGKSLIDFNMKIGPRFFRKSF